MTPTLQQQHILQNQSSSVQTPQQRAQQSLAEMHAQAHVQAQAQQQQQLLQAQQQAQAQAQAAQQREQAIQAQQQHIQAVNSQMWDGLGLGHVNHGVMSYSAQSLGLGGKDPQSMGEEEKVSHIALLILYLKDSR